MNFLFSSQTGIYNKWLHQYRTNLPVAILGKTNHTIWASIKILIVSPNTLKERRKIIIRITEIVQLHDFLRIRRQINLVLRTSVKEISKQTAVTEPAILLLSPLFEPYQLD